MAFRGDASTRQAATASAIKNAANIAAFFISSVLRLRGDRLCNRGLRGSNDLRRGFRHGGNNRLQQCGLRQLGGSGGLVRVDAVTGLVLVFLTMAHNGLLLRRVRVRSKKAGTGQRIGNRDERNHRRHSFSCVPDDSTARFTPTPVYNPGVTRRGRQTPLELKHSDAQLQGKIFAVFRCLASLEQHFLSNQRDFAGESGNLFLRFLQLLSHVSILLF